MCIEFRHLARTLIGRLKYAASIPIYLDIFSRSLRRRCQTALPYSDKRKQLLKMTFLVNEQNVSVMYIDINAISLYIDLNIFQQDECFCSKLGMEVEYAKSNLKTSLGDLSVASFCQSRAMLVCVRKNVRLLHSVNHAVSDEDVWTPDIETDTGTFLSWNILQMLPCLKQLSAWF